MALLELQNLVYYYRTRRGPVHAVDDVSFTIQPGESLAIVGESGCGKTSAGTAILRLLPRNVDRYEGKVLFEGQDTMQLSDEEFRSRIRWKNISMVFQGAMNALSPTKRVGHQVGEPLLLHQELKKEEAFTAATEALKQVGLPEYVARRYPHELSGGMKQRVVIVMALILKPSLVILDEPTSALDVMTQASIINLLKELKREHGLSYIFITHDLGLASELADTLATMYAGKIVEIGNADEFYTKPLHPYTQKLLASVPRLAEESAPEFIPGAPPDLTRPPAGCRFHPRCPYAFEMCGWTSDEVAERLMLGSQSHAGELPPLGRVDTPEPIRLYISPPAGRAPQGLAQDLRAFFRRNPWGELAFKAVAQVSVRGGGVDVWLLPSKTPELMPGSTGSKASCWLLTKGGIGGRG